MLAIRRPRLQHLFGDLGVQLRLTRAYHVGRTRQRGGILRIPPAQISRELHLGGVDVGDRELVRLSVRGHLHHAPIGEIRHDHPRQRLQIRFVVERRRERVACLDEKTHPLLGGLQCLLPFLDLGQRLLELQIGLLQLLGQILGRVLVCLFDRQSLSLFFRRAPRREIARDFREAHERAAPVAQRRDDHVGPKARAILAHAPAFILDASLLRRNLQFAPRLPRAYVLVGVEHREVAADDFLRRVSFEPLSALVPGGDVAGGVEREDRVVDNAVDQKPVQLRVGVFSARSYRHFSVLAANI